MQDGCSSPPGSREGLEPPAHPPALLAARQKLTYSRAAHLQVMIKRVWKEAA